MSTHAVRKHARLSASGRSRWSKCPASIRLSEGLPEVPSSEAAAEGTARHEWAEWCLRNGVVDASELLGFTLIEGEACEFGPEQDATKLNIMTPDAASAINIYLDAVWAALAPTEHTELHVEVALQFPGMHEGLGGTADACVWNASTKTLEIFDFKNGWWVVDVKGNPQLLQYAIGAWMRFKDRRPQNVKLHVIQPRDGTSKVKTWEIDVATLFADKMLLQAQAVATDAADATCVPGEHCTFCPAAHHMACKVRADFVNDEAMRGFTVVERAKTNPGVVTPADLVKMLDALPVIETYVEQLKALAKPLVKEGRVPGKKVVVFQMRTAWNAHRDTISAAISTAFPSVDPFKKPDLRTPSEIETAVGRAAFKDFKSQYTTKSPFGEQIVDVSDERPAVPNAATGFIPITTGP